MRTAPVGGDGGSGCSTARAVQEFELLACTCGRGLYCIRSSDDPGICNTLRPGYFFPGLALACFLPPISQRSRLELIKTYQAAPVPPPLIQKKTWYSQRAASERHP